MSDSAFANPGESLNPRIVVTRLARDFLVRLQILVLTATALLYSLPLVSHSQLQWYSTRWFCVPFLLLPTLAVLRAYLSTRASSERRFWFALLVACVSWLAALVAYGLIPESSWTSAWDAAINSLYLGYYIPMLLAFDQRPWVTEESPDSIVERRLRATGIAVFAIGWTIYSVVAPTLASSTAGKRLVLGSLLFVVLDVTIAARIIGAWRSAPSTRWRWMCGGFGVATLLLLATDICNVLISREWLSWRSPSLTDLVWALPGVALSGAVALRALPSGDAPMPPASKTDRELKPIRVGIYLVIGGVTFPLVHNLLSMLNLVPEADTPLQAAQLFTVMASLTALSGLAIVAYRTLEQQRTKMLQDRQALEAQFLQAQKMEAIGRLAGGVAHDFNNLLTAIGGYTEIVLANLPPGDSNRPPLEEVQSAANRATVLTRQLLTYSRREIVKPERIDVNAAVVNVQRMLRRLVGEDISMTTHLMPDLGPVMADSSQVELVLMNLAVNARDAMPRGGRMVISTCEFEVVEGSSEALNLKPGTYVRINVSDSGVGIPVETLPNLFEPFFTTKERDKGTGLGLATVYAIVSQAGGSVTVNSEPGRGSEFSVCFPRASGTAPVARQAHDPSVPILGRGETILLVEDESAVRALARNSLERCGYTVLVASNATEALTASARHTGRIDLLLTDIVMPGMSGRELAERLTDDRAGLRVLFMTGYTDDAVTRHGLEDAAVSVLHKPFTPSSLGAAVREELDAPS